jgi:hypothetical protein
MAKQLILASDQSAGKLAPGFSPIQRGLPGVTARVFGGKMDKVRISSGRTG